MFRSGAQPGSLFIDSSTIDADVSREMEKQVLKKQCVFMDAPVSGGKKMFQNFLDLKYFLLQA